MVMKWLLVSYKHPTNQSGDLADVSHFLLTTDSEALMEKVLENSWAFRRDNVRSVCADL